MQFTIGTFCFGFFKSWSLGFQRYPEIQLWRVDVGPAVVSRMK